MRLPPLSDPSRLLILGHRGAVLESAAFHENSLAAFEEALTHADGFETDACVDAEGDVFLVHEAKYVTAQAGVVYCLTEHLDDASRAVLGDRRLDQLPTALVNALRLRDGSPIPSLKQAIERMASRPGKLLNIELKAYQSVEPVLRLVHEAQAARGTAGPTTLISSFNHPALATVREKSPHTAIGAIFLTEEQPAAPLFPWWPGSAGMYTPLTPQALRAGLLHRIDPDVFVLPEELLTQKTLDMVAAEFPQATLMFWVFTERGNPDVAGLLQRLQRLQPSGKIAALMVDHPREFRARAASAGIRLASDLA